MKRILALMLSISALLPCNSQERFTLNLKYGKSMQGESKEIPYRDIEQTDDALIVRYDISEANISTDKLFPGKVYWRVNGFGQNYAEAQPSIPVRTDCILIPDGCEARLELVDSAYVEYPCELSPSRPLKYAIENVSREKVSEIKPYKGLFPSRIVEIDQSQEYRGHALCDISVMPVQYNYEKKMVRAYTRLAYKVNFVQTDAAMARAANARPIRVTDSFLENTTLNGGLMRSPALPDASPAFVEDTLEYLILSTPAYESVIDSFAIWKRTLGFNTHVELRNDWTENLIKSTVRQYYESEKSLDYLLIVGNQSDVPAKIKQSELFSNDTLYEHATDFHYSHFGSNYLLTPSIKKGRIDVSNPNEAYVVLQKIINYEYAPPSLNSFYSNGLNCAYFQDRDSFENVGDDGIEDMRFTLTSEEILDYLTT